MHAYNLRPESFAQASFGNVMLQIMGGDFLQLNPVKSLCSAVTFRTYRYKFQAFLLTRR